MLDFINAICPKIIQEFGLVIKYKIDLHYEKTDKTTWLGQCGFHSGKFIIKINNNLENKQEIAMVLLHELIHAHCMSIGYFGHESEFRKLSEKFGFRGHPTQNTGKQFLIERLDKIIKQAA